MRLSSAFVAILLIAPSICLADDESEDAKVGHKIELLGGILERDKSLPGRPVVGVTFQETNKFSEKYIHLLKVFKTLKSLDLVGIRITEVGFKEITELKQSLPNLTLLYDDPREAPAIEKIEQLGGTVKRSSTLPGRLAIAVNFFAAQPGANGRFTDQEVALLDEFTSLIDVSIPFSGITDVGLKTLKKKTNLRSLDLFEANISDAGLKEIAELTQLKSLRLDSCKKISDAGLKELTPLKKLNDLGLASTAITDAGLKELKELTNLSGLHLSGTAVTDAGLQELSELKNLTTLDLANTKVTDAGLNQLGTLKNLTVLDLMFCKRITDDGLHELCSMKNLTRLRLLDTEVTEDGIDKLKQSLPDALIVR